MRNRSYFRFTLRTTLLIVAIVAVALWWFVARPRTFQQRQTLSGRKLIQQRDRLWLEACFDQTVRDHLVTVLGDSRLSHWGSVRWLFQLDPETIVSYGADHALIVWNRADGSIRHGYFDVAFAARAVDAGKIFMGDSAGNVRLWSAAENTFHEVQFQVPVLRNPACASAPDGAYFAYGTYGKQLSVWDATTGQLRQTIDPGKELKTDDAVLSWAPLAITKQNRLILASPLLIAEFDLLSGEVIGTIDVPTTSDGSRASVFEMRLSEDEKRLLVADAAGRVMAFDMLNRQFVENAFEGQGSVLDVALDSDGSSMRVARGDGVLGLQFLQGRQVDVRVVYRGTVSALGQPSFFLIGNRSGQIVILNGDDELRLAGGPRGDATRFAYSPSGDRIALAGRDGRIVIRETATWNQRNAWSAHYGVISHVEWSRDGQQLVSFGADRVVAVWNPVTGIEVAALKSFAFPYRTPTFDPTGNSLVLQHLTRESYISLYDIETWTERQSIPQDAFSPRGPVLFSRDGTKLFAGGRTTVQVWDLESKKVIAKMGGQTSDEVRLAISPNGKVLYTLMNRQVEAFDLSSYRSLWSTKLNATRSFSVAVHPDNSLLVVGDNEGAVVLLDPMTGKILKHLRMGPTRGEIQQVGFSPDGELLTAAMSNGAVVVMRTPQLP